MSAFIPIGAAAQQIADRLQRLHTEERLFAALAAAGPSLAAASPTAPALLGAEMIISREERAALLTACEYFLGLAAVMPAHWIRPGVVAACIDLADRLGPKTRDEKHRIPGSTRASVTKHLKKLGLKAPQQREEGVVSRFRRLKQSTRVMPGAAICCDCGMDTMPRTGGPRTHEQFIVNDDVWIAAGMTPGKIDPKTYELIGGGFLCVGCIEVRLGRRLTVGDFRVITIPLLLGDPWCSERLRSRALYRSRLEEDAAKVAPPTKWQTELTKDGVALTMTLEPPETETSFEWVMS